MWGILNQMLNGLSSNFDIVLQSILFTFQLCSNQKIEFQNEVLSNGDLLIENLKLDFSGNFTCSVINLHGHDLITHTIMVHGKFQL